MLTGLLGMVIKMGGEVAVKAMLGAVKEYLARKDIRDKERMRIALEMFEQSTEAYDFLRGSGDTKVRVREDATGIVL